MKLKKWQDNRLKSKRRSHVGQDHFKSRRSEVKRALEEHMQSRNRSKKVPTLEKEKTITSTIKSVHYLQSQGRWPPESNTQARREEMRRENPSPPTTFFHQITAKKHRSKGILRSKKRKSRKKTPQIKKKA